MFDDILHGLYTEKLMDYIFEFEYVNSIEEYTFYMFRVEDDNKIHELCKVDGKDLKKGLKIREDDEKAIYLWKCQVPQKTKLTSSLTSDLFYRQVVLALGKNDPHLIEEFKDRFNKEIAQTELKRFPNITVQTIIHNLCREIVYILWAN